MPTLEHQSDNLPSSRAADISNSRKYHREQIARTDGLSPVFAFYVFSASAILAALYSPVQDCDEVFNYWEPSHYLNHGYGLQTWEYSPAYAIRSWAYAGIHSSIITATRILPIGKSKVTEFYFLRIVFAMICAASQTKLFSVVSRSMSPRIAILFLIITVTSTGMFHASTAYLPSTFAMYTTMLGVAAFLNWRGGIRSAQGIMWFGIGATLGWPFAAALVIPFILEEVLLVGITGEPIPMLARCLDGTVRSLIVLAVQIAIDVFFYRKLVVVPLNIVLYNVFGGSSKGPDIYGTEPWHFYFRNLALNFNVWFILALGSVPLVMLQHLLRSPVPTRQTVLRNLTVLTPFYLWLAIFTLQPHKEERFMYPIYPLLILNAAFSVHLILTSLGSTDLKSYVNKIPLRLRIASISLVLFAAIVLGLLRNIGMSTAYSAPLRVYAPLQDPNMTRYGDTVCLGKEWYRFPSSFFLPDGVKAKFVRSEFKGLLPGEFSEARVGFGFFPGAWLEPSGMNDENKEDPGKYTDIEHCTYLVDSRFPDSTPTTLEPDYIADAMHWERIKCVPYLDVSKTGLLGRMFWVPELRIIPMKLRRQWGDYCLLKRK